MPTENQSAAPAAQHPALELVNKPNLTTQETAHYLNRRPQTLRCWAMKNGIDGLRPKRINGLLAWPTQQVKALAGLTQSGFANIAMMAGVAAVAYFAPGLIDLSMLAIGMTAIYRHPDGHEIDFADNTLTVVSADGAAVSIPMGVGGLRQLANGFTESDCAAQAGAAIAENCLDAMQIAIDQTECVSLLTDALIDLTTLKHPEHAAAGFAGAMVEAIEARMGGDSMSRALTAATAGQIGTNALAAMLESSSQGECLQVLRAALIQLVGIPHQRTAAAAFVNALTAPIVECRKPERESQTGDDIGRALNDVLNRNKSIRYSHETNTCPDCGAPTEFLNIERNHYEVCRDCKKFHHFGENLHSAWRDESVEVWQANAKLLKGYTEFDAKFAAPPAGLDDLDLPF